jgi:hypothetical protein
MVNLKIFSVPEWAVIVAVPLLVAGVIVGLLPVEIGLGEKGIYWFPVYPLVLQPPATLKSGEPAPTPAPSNRSTPIATPALAGTAYLDTGPPVKTTHEVTPGSVTIGGRRYQHGVQFDIGVGSEQQSASYNIPLGAKKFSAAIGNDDTQPNSFWNTWQLTYQVLVDGRRATDGHVLGMSHDPPLEVDLSGGSQIELRIVAPLNAGRTHADWGDPKFE